MEKTENKMAVIAFVLFTILVAWWSVLNTKMRNQERLQACIWGGEISESACLRIACEQASWVTMPDECSNISRREIVCPEGQRDTKGICSAILRNSQL